MNIVDLINDFNYIFSSQKIIEVPSIDHKESGLYEKDLSAQ